MVDADSADAGHAPASAPTGAAGLPSALAEPVVLERVAYRFGVLGEPMRLRILIALKAGERSVGEVVDATGANQANVSRHLSTLVQAGILARRKAGTRVYYRIADESVFELCRVVCGRLQAEEQALRAEPPRDWSI